jgi:hypothetical protein
LRILFNAWSFPGHINPTVALARALAERGHEIAFSTGERARAVIEWQGFSFYPFQFLDEESVYTTMFSPASRSMLSLAAFFKDWLLTTLPDQVGLATRSRRLETGSRGLRCDHVGRAAGAAGATGVPCVICSLAPGCLIPSPDVPPWGLGLALPHNWSTRLVCRAARLLTEMSVSGLRRTANEMQAQIGLPPLGIPINEYHGRTPLYLVSSVPNWIIIAATFRLRSITLVR